MWFHFFLCLLNLIVFRGRLSIFKLICGNCIILRINFLRFNVCLLLSFILLLDSLGLLLGNLYFFLSCFLAILLGLNLIGQLRIFKLICGNCIILRMEFLRFDFCLLLSFILLLDFLGLLLGIRRFFLCCFLALLLFLNLIINIFIIESIGNNIKITLCLFIRRHLFLCYQIFTIVHNTGTFKLFDFIRIVSTFLLSWLSLLQLLFVLSNLLLVLSYLHLVLSYFLLVLSYILIFILI